MQNIKNLEPSKKKTTPKKTKKQPANCKKEFRTSDRLKNNLYIYGEYLQNSKIVVENQIKDIKRQFKKDDYRQPINSLPLKKILDI